MEVVSVKNNRTDARIFMYSYVERRLKSNLIAR